VGGVARRAAGDGVGAAAARAAVLQVDVVAAGDPDVHGGVGAGERPGGQAGVVDRLDGQFQQQALLRVEPLGLAGGDVGEEGGVEAGDVVQEAAGGGVAPAGPGGAGTVGVDPACRVEAVRRDLGDQVAAVGEGLPQVVEPVDATRQAAGD